MRYIIISMLLLSCFQIEAFQTKITHEYDEFSDENTLLLQNDYPKYNTGGPTFLNFFVVNKGEKIQSPDIVLMSIIQHNRGWKYLRCTQTYFLIDDERYDFGEPDHNGDVIYGSTVQESFHYEVDYEVFKQLAIADKVRFKICNTEFYIDKKGRDHLRQYYNKLLKSISE